jgi:hypothetical protein
MTAGLFTANSTAADTAVAIREVRSQLAATQTEFVLLLHGPNHIGSTLEQALQNAADSRFFGCSTSGEITPRGYRENSLSAIGFDSSVFSCVSRKIAGLREFGFQQAHELVLAMKWELQQKAPNSSPASTFALLLIDSSSMAEEFVAAALGSELGNIHLVGGSSGDNWRSERTPVLFDGRFCDDSAVLLLVHTELAFRHYNFHNLVASDLRGVITAATPAERLVHEINGAPAVEEYARLCNVRPEELNRDHLSIRPAIITVGDRAYPRGFMEILEDGSLRCACAIDEGLVFRVSEQVDYVQQLQQALEKIREDLGSQLTIIAFECAARKGMVELNDLQNEVSSLFTSFNVWGFSCMGEQTNSLNMNNSFNCLAFATRS